MRKRKSNKSENSNRHTSLIKAKNELTERKYFFRDIIDSIQDGISILDKDLNIIFVNSAIKKWYPHKLPLVGLKCYDAYHGRTLPCEICPSLRTLKTGRQDFDIVPLSGPEGIKGWLHLFSFPLLDSKDGNLTGVIEYVRDISNLKRTEEALRDSEERFRSLAQTAIDAIVTTDSDGTIMFWNKGAEIIFGYKRDEVLGKPLTILMPERYRNLHQETMESIFLSATSADSVNGKPFELDGLRKDGRELPIEVSVAAWQTKKGTFYTTIIRDITKRKLMEDQLRSLSLVDELTGLYNRRGFFTLAQQQLKMADRLHRGLFLIFADLDGLKNINDNFGHQEGSSALVDSANILKETFRESDIIARIGGDEFVIMAIETADTDPDVFGMRLQEDIKSFNATSNRVYQLSISTGIASYDPYFPCSLEELLEKADAQMYEQKRIKKLRLKS